VEQRHAHGPATYDDPAATERAVLTRLPVAAPPCRVAVVELGLPYPLGDDREATAP